MGRRPPQRLASRWSRCPSGDADKLVRLLLAVDDAARPRPRPDPRTRRGQPVLPGGDRPPPDRRRADRSAGRSLAGRRGDRRGRYPRHRAGRAGRAHRPAGGLRQARPPARGGRRPRVLAGTRPAAPQRGRGAARRRAPSPRGARPDPVPPRLRARRRARVHLQARPHAGRRVREHAAPGPAGRARGGGDVARGDRRRRARGVRRAARLSLLGGGPGPPLGRPRGSPATSGKRRCTTCFSPPGARGASSRSRRPSPSPARASSWPAPPSSDPRRSRRWRRRSTTTTGATRPSAASARRRICGWPARPRTTAGSRTCARERSRSHPGGPAS